MWNDIVTNDDIEALLDLYGGFHDSFVECMEYVSPCSIDEELGFFKKPEADADLLVRFSRQFRNPRVVELMFGGLIEINFKPTLDVVRHCSIQRHGERLYWAEAVGFEPSKLPGLGCNWICASRIQWRRIPDSTVRHPMRMSS